MRGCRKPCNGPSMIVTSYCFLGLLEMLLQGGRRIGRSSSTVSCGGYALRVVWAGLRYLDDDLVVSSRGTAAVLVGVCPRLVALALLGLVPLQSAIYVFSFSMKHEVFDFTQRKSGHVAPCCSSFFSLVDCAHLMRCSLLHFVASNG